MPRAVACKSWAITRQTSVQMTTNWVPVGKKCLTWWQLHLHQGGYGTMWLHLWYVYVYKVTYERAWAAPPTEQCVLTEHIPSAPHALERIMLLQITHAQVNAAALKQVLQQQQTAAIFDVRPSCVVMYVFIVAYVCIVVCVCMYVQKIQPSFCNIVQYFTTY